MKLFILYRIARTRFRYLFSACGALAFGAASVASLVVVSVAGASLTGDASLTYSTYNERDKHSNHVSSSSLVQNYSLLYSSSGTLYNSRVGNYDVSLGYNWTALDTEFKSSGQPNESYNETRGHLLYNGEINLDPKEVPFRLHAYSRDMTRNSVTSTEGRYPQNMTPIYDSRMQATGINDGMHIESGATLVAGVKNGMTNGYNEILRHFPMILIDYKDTINRDLRSSSPVDDRLSRLAFVSLNKKENWFHYRHTLYEDNLNNLNNYVENEVQIGTVDQFMSRRWVDFANWLKVSTDLELSRRKSNYQANPIEDINLNLFVTAERATWNARTFSTFNRNKDENNKLTYQAVLPLYVSGVVSQDLSWNTRTSFRSNHDLTELGARSRFTDVLAGYRVDALKRAPFTLSQSFDVETSETNTSDFVMLSGALETVTTPRFSRNVHLGASYTIKNSSTSVGTGSSSDFLEQTLNLHGAYAPSATLRYEARQNTTFTRGNFASFAGTTGDATTQLSQYVNPRNVGALNVGSDSFHSLTSVTVSWEPKPRLNTFFTVNEDIYRTPVIGVSGVTEALTGITYTNAAWSVSDTLKYSHGSRDTFDDNSNSVSNSSAVRYVHSRNFDIGGTATYSEVFAHKDSYRTIDVVQNANYNYFTKSGVMRKLLEFNETLKYSDNTQDVNQVFNKSLMLGFRYYPIKQLTLAGGAGYAYVSSITDYSIVWNASVAANFRLMQVSLDYVHGMRKADGARENKFTGNIRKSF